MIHLISCSAKTAKNLKEKYPHAAMVDVRHLHDPSPTCQDLFGDDLQVFDAMTNTYADKLMVFNAIGLVSQEAKTHGKVIVFCEGGWQRSVAIVEHAAMSLIGYRVKITHMEAIPQNPNLTPHDVLQMMRSELADMRRYDEPLTAEEFAYHVHNLEEALGEPND